jgi:hypothetical protein
MPNTQSGALTDAQLAGYAKGAGFSGNGLVLAVAVALAETRGHPTATAHNPNPPDNSYGPWQINMYGSLGPARRKQFGLSRNEDLFNVATNAKAAYAISSQGKNFTPWSTYLDGKYLAYMSRARKAANAPDSSGGNPSGGTSGSGSVVQAGFLGISEVTAFFEFITDPITWLRAGMILAGGLLLLFALYALSGQADKAKALVKTATDVLPQTRGLKAAAKAV